MIHSADHWENVYRNKNFDAVSWYAPYLGESLRLLGYGSAILVLLVPCQ
jgi:hypothetical protein